MIQSFDDYEFDANKLELRRAGRPIKADRLLLRILRVLVRRPGDLITKHEIVAEVWDDRAVSDNALSVSMARLRKLLGHERSRREMVLNVHGRGYRFMRPVTARDAALGSRDRGRCSWPRRHAVRRSRPRADALARGAARRRSW